MLRKDIKIVLAGAGACIVLGLALVACTGSTDGGEADFTGSEFVASDSTVGTIRLEVADVDLAVSETSSFEVFATNASGEPVPQLQISCDTEAGLAILEPNTGSELTGEYGGMSGVVGCEAPGSFQMACRLPIGANKRKFVRIHCNGSVPTGFSGFPGTVAGGGLGGGVSVNDDGGVGGTDSGGVRLAQVLVYEGYDDGPSETTSQVDVIQDQCPIDCSGSDCTPESFSDTYVQMKIVNNTNQVVRCASYFYRVPTTSSTITSDTISLNGELEVGVEGGETTVNALFADAISSCGSLSGTPDGCKTLAGETSPMAEDFGFKNVRFTVNCTNDLGEDISVSATKAISFGDYLNDPC